MFFSRETREHVDPIEGGLVEHSGVRKYHVLLTQVPDLQTGPKHSGLKGYMYRCAFFSSEGHSVQMIKSIQRESLEFMNYIPALIITEFDFLLIKRAQGAGEVGCSSSLETWSSELT